MGLSATVGAAVETAADVVEGLESFWKRTCSAPRRALRP